MHPYSVSPYLVISLCISSISRSAGYVTLLESILLQSQQMLYEQWKNILELDTCLRDADTFGDIIRQEG